MLEHHETVEAPTALDALRLLEGGEDFDLIICDVMMPEMSGIDLHAWLVSNNPRLAKQLIFITGGAFTPKAREYISKVDNIRLSKPFDAQGVRRVTGELVALSKVPGL